MNENVVVRVNHAQAILFVLMFLFFALSSADLLHIVVYIFKPKIGHLVAVVLMGWFVFLYRYLRIPKEIGFVFLGLLASFCLSALCGAAPVRSFGYLLVYLFNFCFYFLLPFNLLQQLPTASIMRCYFHSFVAVGLYSVFQIVLSLFNIVEPFALQVVDNIVRGQAWTYEPSYYALYMTSFVMLKNGLAIFGVDRARSWNGKKQLLGINGFLFASTSTGVVLTYPVAALIYGWISFFSFVRPFAVQVHRRLVYLLIAFFSSLGVLGLIFQDIVARSFYKFFLDGFLHFSIQARWAGIVNCWNVFLENPLLGVGLGGVGPYIYKSRSFYDAIPSTLQEFEAFDPTNCFMEVLASLGIVGFIGFVFLGWAFYRLFKSVMLDRGINSVDKKWAMALIASLLIQVFVLQYNQGLFRPYIWIHAAVVYGMLYRMKKEAIT
jgi:hypothetical protein